MAAKKINVITFVILPVLVAVTTIVLFFLFKEDNSGKIFYINLLYTIVLETLFFIFLAFSKKPRNSFSGAFLSIIGVNMFIYIILGALWMIVFTYLLTTILSLKIYVTVIVLLTLIWIILSVLITKTDADFKETVNELTDSQNSLLYFSQKMKILVSKYEVVCKNKGIVYKTDSNNTTELSKLSNKLNFLTPNVIKNQTAVSQLNLLLENCANIIDEIESSTEEKDTLEKKMSKFVNDALNEIELIKTLSRK